MQRPALRLRCVMRWATSALRRRSSASAIEIVVSICSRRALSSVVSSRMPFNAGPLDVAQTDLATDLAAHPSRPRCA